MRRLTRRYSVRVRDAPRGDRPPDFYVRNMARGRPPAGDRAAPFGQADYDIGIGGSRLSRTDAEAVHAMLEFVLSRHGMAAAYAALALAGLREPG